jgi:hypothetical protein
MPSSPLTPRQIRWARRWMTLILFGLIIFVIGVDPKLIHMKRSHVVGFVQMGTWTFGLAMVLLGAFSTVRVVRNGRPTTLRASIGARLVATGFVISTVASFADLLGIGSHHLPNIVFGPLQVAGLAGGVLISLLGVVLYWPRSAKPELEVGPV